MQALGRQIVASYAFVERNFNLVRRYLGWEIVFLVYTTVNTLTIGLIGVVIDGSSGQDRVLYLIIGALLWGFLSDLFHTVSESVSWERWEGTIEYTFMAPIHRLTHLGGTCLFGIAYGVLRTVIIMGAVSLFFDLDLSRANLWTGLIVLIASSLSFIGLGLVAAVLPLMSPERGPQATHIIQGLLLLISGVYYPIEVLPAWLQPIARISPATFTLDAARAGLLDGASIADVSGLVWKLLLIGVILIPIGYLIFSWGEEYAMRTGKLKRNG